MANEESTGQVRVQTRARPWSGFFLGLLLGLSIAVILQQAGIWPLDRLLVFGLGGLFSLLGILVAGLGRERVSGYASAIPLVLSVLMLAWGATGITQLDDHGELNGGCTVEASSDVDSTIMTDTTRSDPFEIDPDGGLSWTATSPAPITDHTWEIWVDVGGFRVEIADGGDANSAGDQESSGNVDDLDAYVEEVTAVSGSQLRGVFQVGGEIEGDGGECDGFAFVKLTSDPLSTLISQIAAAVGLIALISLIVIATRRTRLADVVPDEAPGAETAAGAATAATTIDTEPAGRHSVPPESTPETGVVAPPPGEEIVIDEDDPPPPPST